MSCLRCCCPSLCAGVVKGPLMLELGVPADVSSNIQRNSCLQSRQYLLCAYVARLCAALLCSALPCFPPRAAGRPADLQPPYNHISTCTARPSSSPVPSRSVGRLQPVCAAVSCASCCLMLCVCCALPCCHFLQVAAATSATMIMFTAGSACLVYSRFGQILYDYACVLLVLGFLVTLCSQLLTFLLVKLLGRRSVIVFMMVALMVSSTAHTLH